MSYVLIGLVIYFVSLFLVSYRIRESQPHSGFVIGGRRIGVWGTSLSQLVSISDGTGFVIVLMLAVVMGGGFFWGILGLVLGYLPLALQATKIRTLAEEKNYVTVTDFLEDRVGPVFGKFSSWLIILIVVMTIGGQLNISGYFFGEFLGVPHLLGIVLVASVVAAYMLAGGYVNVIRTDILQGILVLSLAAGAYIFGTYPSGNEIWSQFTGMTMNGGWALLLFMIPINYAWVDTWQRIFSASSPQTARQATYINMFFNGFTFTGFIILALTIHAYHPEIAPDRLVYDLFTQTSLMGGLGVALGVVFLALIMSSLDSRVYTVSSTFACNVLNMAPEENHKRFVKLLRAVMLTVFIGMSVVATMITDVVQYMINVASMMGILMPSLFLGVYTKPNNRKRYDRLMTGVTALAGSIWVWMFLTDMFQGFSSNLVPLAVGAPLALLVWGVDRQSARVS